MIGSFVQRSIVRYMDTLYDLDNKCPSAYLIARVANQARKTIPQDGPLGIQSVNTYLQLDISFSGTHELFHKSETV